MLRKDPAYRRLKVGGAGLSGTASYWLGPDHLFVVATNSYVERYHRFMFADIQALVIRRNRLQAVWAVLSAVVAAAGLLGAWETLGGRTPASLDPGTLTGFIILAGVGVVFLILLVLNWLLGPTCVCHLRTAVQTLPLPQIRRWRKAQLLARELAPLVSAAQAHPGSISMTTTPIRVDLPEAAEPTALDTGPNAPPDAAL